MFNNNEKIVWREFPQAKLRFKYQIRGQDTDSDTIPIFKIMLLSGSPKYFDPLYSFKATVDVSPGYGTVSESVSKTTKSLWNEDILEMIFRYRGTVTGKIKQLLPTTRPLGQQVSRLQCSQNSGENVEKI